MKTFLLILIASLMLSVQFSHGQERTSNLRGNISDSGGDPLAGATIQLKGSTRGVIADVDGNYNFPDCPIGSTLVVSFIGMESIEQVYAGESTIDFVLNYQADVLDEVTVVAFARQKKESILASITTVEPGELKVPSSNLTTAFAGRVAGLISYQTTGEPGQDNANFFIRGITTFGAEAKKDPLILIDGIELGTDDLARLNTDDIASFSVMKDATATALYGARGANGVILVTTKEGREGKARFSARLENSFSSPTKKVDIADPVTFMRMHNEAVKTRDPLGLMLYSEEKITLTERGLYPDIFPATNWYDAMFNDVISNQRANLSVSGGGSVARYYVAANISRDRGNLKIDKRNNFNSNINLMKYNFRSNVNINLSNSTELIARLSANFDEYTGPLDGGTGMYRKVVQANPVLFKPSYEPDEEFSYAKHILFGNYGNAQYINPYAESLRGYRDYGKNTMIVSFELKQDLNSLVEGLTTRALFNFNRFSEYIVTRQYNPFYYSISRYDLQKNSYKLQRLNPTEGTEFIDYTPRERYINNTFYVEAAAEYNRNFNSLHDVNALFVYTMRDYKVGVADNLQLSLPARNIGLAGRLAYNYDVRYFAEFNFGYNGSERFSSNNRWGFFPSFGAAWMISNEPFFEPLLDVFSQFKLKGTFGLVGNDAIGDWRDRFYYLSEIDMYADRSVNWGTQLNYNPGGINTVRYSNDRIGWETAYKTNFGFELNTVMGLSANVDIFKEKRTNILLDRVIPSTMGVIPPVKANLGEAEGKGIDIEMNYEKILNQDLWFVGRGTFTYATSKATKWEEPDYSQTPWSSRVGKSLAQTWGYVAERLFIDEYEVANSPTQFGNYMAGDIKYRDINNDGKISELDKVPIGFPTVPEINYGFGLTVGYKKIDASFFFQGSGRQSFWLDLFRTTPFLDSDADDGRLGQNSVLQAYADSYWSETNRDPYAFWPRLANYSIENNNQTSTWFMQDASFLRLKSVELGYTVPDHINKRLNMSNLRVYVSGTNLFSWSSFKLWDPEMAGNGLGYPIQRVINVGLNIGF